LLDLARIKEERPDLYKAASDIAQGNPNVVLTGIDAEAATELATLMRGTFDDVFELMRVNGIDLQYAEDYFPLLYSKAGKEQREAARLLTAGAQGVRGKGYDPTKTRTAFFKDKLDANGAPVLDEFGQKIRVQMAPYEIKQELVRLGLPDDIETDILTLINRQVLAAGKMVAGKRLADDLINKGALTPGGVQQFAIPETTRKLIAENLNPNAVAAGVADIFSTPSNLSAYLRTLDANNPEDVAKVSDMLGAVAQAIGPRQTKTGAKKMKLTQEEYESARAAFAQAKRISQSPTAGIAPELAGRGLVQVGEDRIGYLPEQYAGMFGDKALVDMVNRYLFPEYNVGELEATARALMQSFKTFATFGRGTGFVARNGLGAAQQNFLGGVSALPRSGYKTGDYGPAAAITAASARADYYMGKLSKIVSTDPKTDKIVSLVPTSRGAAGGKLSRSPQIVTVNGLIDKMVKENVVDATTATAMKADLDQFGIIRQDTISGAHDAIIRRSLDALPDYEGIPLTTIYETSVKSGVVDPTKIMGEILQGPVDDAVFSKLIRGSDRVDLRPDKAESDKGLITKAANRAVNLAPIRYNRQFNNRVEQEVRTAAITAGLRMFGNDETGQEIANAFMKGLHFDYSNLTDVEKRYMQMVMPFWTWTKNNIPLQFRNLMLNPGRANKIIETNEGIESVFADDSGDIYYMPSWLKESFGFVTGSSPAGYPLVVRLESPIVDINKFFHGEGAPIDTKEFLSGANPLAKSLIQWQAGTNLYTGASYPEEGVEAPEWYKSMLKLPGLEGLLPSNRKKDGTILMPGALRDGIKDNIPTIGLLERLGTPGFTSPEQKERVASNLPSIILGAPLATLTPQQETGELISRNEGLRANINDWAGRNGVDLDALRATVNSGQYTSEELAQLLAQGYFLKPTEE
jgi:hypothetical protein